MVDWHEMEKDGFSIMKLRRPRRCTAFSLEELDPRAAGVNVPRFATPAFLSTHPSTRINSDDEIIVSGDSPAEYSRTACSCAEASTPCTQVRTTPPVAHCSVVASTDGPLLAQAHAVPRPSTSRQPGPPWPAHRRRSARESPTRDASTRSQPPRDDCRRALTRPRSIEPRSPPRIPCRVRVRSESRRAGVGIDMPREAHQWARRHSASFRDC